MAIQLSLKCAAPCLVLVNNDALLLGSEIIQLLERRVFRDTATVCTRRLRQSVVRVEKDKVGVAYGVSRFQQPAATLRGGRKGLGEK
jgi:hypothetical protein